ncbi:MAG: hypothetical protein IPL94_08870 [Tetrasphaera sp.]|nr:hypothetical protein [Tetrasphaera sp.]
MTRDQLAHILRAAARIANDDEIIVIGSQAILGSFDEDDLPEPAHASIGVDVFFAKDPDLAKTDGVDGHLGEGLSLSRNVRLLRPRLRRDPATLPDGWQDRLVPLPHRSHRVQQAGAWSRTI